MLLQLSPERGINTAAVTDWLCVGPDLLISYVGDAQHAAPGRLTGDEAQLFLRFVEWGTTENQLVRRHRANATAARALLQEAADAQAE